MSLMRPQGPGRCFFTPLLAAVAAGAFAVRPASGRVTVSNVVPRTDANGSYMDAHDGNTVQFTPGGPYFWYAMGYGQCRENGVSADGHCGMLSNNTVGVWMSPDLSHGSWRKVGGLRMSSDGWPKCTYYRSHGAYSKRTGKYVLWLNAEPGKDSQCTACADSEGGGKSTHCYLAGSSDSPSGPFTYRGVVPVNYTWEGGVGDFTLFVDDNDDGTGYVLYKRTGAAGAYGREQLCTVRPPPSSCLLAVVTRSAVCACVPDHMTLQQLSPDLLGVVPSASVSTTDGRLLPLN